MRKILRDHGPNSEAEIQCSKADKGKAAQEAHPMVGVILSLPPRDARDRANCSAHGDTRMRGFSVRTRWRRQPICKMAFKAPCAGHARIGSKQYLSQTSCCLNPKP